MIVAIGLSHNAWLMVQVSYLYPSTVSKMWRGGGRERLNHPPVQRTPKYPSLNRVICHSPFSKLSSLNIDFKLFVFICILYKTLCSSMSVCHANRNKNV